MAFVLRSILADGGTHKGTSSCSAKGCTKTTREGKPYCSNHIECGWYIRVILSKLASASEEAAILDNPDGGELPRDGFYVREGLLLLRMGSYTAKGFSRKLDLSHDAAKRLIEMLAKWGLARMNRTPRKDLTISGLGKPDLAEPRKERKKRAKKTTS